MHPCPAIRLSEALFVISYHVLTMALTLTLTPTRITASAVRPT